MKKELVSRKEPALDNSGNSLPIQIAKDAKTRKFTVSKVCSEEKAMDVVGYSLAGASKGSKG